MYYSMNDVVTDVWFVWPWIWPLFLQAPFLGYYHLNILDQGGVITAILQDDMTNSV
jgi:hypothetical protein